MLSVTLVCIAAACGTAVTFSWVCTSLQNPSRRKKKKKASAPSPMFLSFSPLPHVSSICPFLWNRSLKHTTAGQPVSFNPLTHEALLYFSLKGKKNQMQAHIGVREIISWSPGALNLWFGLFVSLCCKLLWAGTPASPLIYTLPSTPLVISS